MSRSRDEAAKLSWEDASLLICTALGLIALTFAVRGVIPTTSIPFLLAGSGLTLAAVLLRFAPKDDPRRRELRRNAALAGAGLVLAAAVAVFIGLPMLQAQPPPLSELRTGTLQGAWRIARTKGGTTAYDLVVDGESYRYDCGRCGALSDIGGLIGKPVQVRARGRDVFGLSGPADVLIDTNVEVADRHALGVVWLIAAGLGALLMVRLIGVNLFALGTTPAGRDQGSCGAVR